ncbi:hypothetical protein SAMN02745166_03557 [Prosthecobacter debontii]|uniref:Uncharacterized protein n=1 Tax=Prosthecobacter debontii TaxID=48467 RepID=A0A1T4YJW5_9BACT|nr:hypothetical protein [Prosthecobacter debontii]SKB02147.1 hypothetical protein SAMN02745166_03557 [Prosthecobacter debontii]
MTALQTACAKILSELEFEKPQEHAFYLLVTEKEQTAVFRSGWFFPVWYLAIGAVLVLIALLAGILSLEQTGKLCGSIRANKTREQRLVAVGRMSGVLLSPEPKR